MKTRVLYFAFCLLLTGGAAVAKSGPFQIDQPPPAAADPVDDLYLQGNYAQSKGNYEYAIACWDRVLRLRPDDATAYYNRAVAYDSDKKPDKALADLDAVIKLTPGDPQAYEFRARIALETAGTPPQGDALAKALADYDAALQLRLKDVADPTDWLTKKAGSAENSVQAIACCNAIIKLNPKSSPALLGRALTYQKMGDVEKALADYAAAEKLDPKNKDVYWNRAMFNLDGYDNGRARDIASGAADLSSLIQLAPDSGLHAWRGEVYEVMGEDGKAIADFTEAIRLTPNDARPLEDRAEVYEKLRDWDKVIADYTSIISFVPDGSRSYYERAHAHYQKHEWEKAIPDLDKAIERYKVEMAKNFPGATEETLLTNESHMLELRGAAYYHMRQWEKALADFNPLYAKSAGEWQGRRGAAWIYATCPDDKIRDGTKALKIALELCAVNQWTSGAEIDTLAAAEAECGHWEDAVNYEKMALKIDKADQAGNRSNTSNSPAVLARIEADYEGQIKAFTARLALYQQKKTSRDEKEPLEYLFF